MATRLVRYKVNPVYIRNELKKINVSTLVLAVLVGYSDRTEVNKQLREGAVTQEVFDALLKLEIRP